MIIGRNIINKISFWSSWLSLDALDYLLVVSISAFCHLVITFITIVNHHHHQWWFTTIIKNLWRRHCDGAGSSEQANSTQPSQPGGPVCRALQSDLGNLMKYIWPIDDEINPCSFSKYYHAFRCQAMQPDLCNLMEGIYLYTINIVIAHTVCTCDLGIQLCPYLEITTDHTHVNIRHQTMSYQQ